MSTAEFRESLKAGPGVALAKIERHPKTAAGIAGALGIAALTIFVAPKSGVSQEAVKPMERASVLTLEAVPSPQHTPAEMLDLSLSEGQLTVKYTEFYNRIMVVAQKIRWADDKVTRDLQNVAGEEVKNFVESSNKLRKTFDAFAELVDRMGKHDFLVRSRSGMSYEERLAQAQLFATTMQRIEDQYLSLLDDVKLLEIREPKVRRSLRGI